MTLAAGGVFNATAGLNGIYAKFDSLAIVGQVISSDNAQHYGDVNVQSTGGLLRASASQSVNQSPVITGRSITVGGGSGSVGAVGNPLVLQPNPTILVNGGKRDGVVNALAQIGYRADSPAGGSARGQHCFFPGQREPERSQRQHRQCQYQ